MSLKSMFDWSFSPLFDDFSLKFPFLSQSKVTTTTTTTTTKKKDDKKTSSKWVETLKDDCVNIKFYLPETKLTNVIVITTPDRIKVSTREGDKIVFNKIYFPPSGFNPDSVIAKFDEKNNVLMLCLRRYDITPRERNVPVMASVNIE